MSERKLCSTLNKSLYFSIISSIGKSVVVLSHHTWHQFTGGQLEVTAHNACGISDPLIINLKVGNGEWCILADCFRSSTFVDTQMLSNAEAIDVFKANISIDSDALQHDGQLVFKAGVSIELFPGLPVAEMAIFTAQIERCD